jgi:hypothetical protein
MAKNKNENRKLGIENWELRTENGKKYLYRIGEMTCLWHGMTAP